MIQPNESSEGWFKRHFIGTELGYLALLIILIATTLWFLGGILTPILVSIVIAYLLDGPVKSLQRWKLSHFMAVNLVFILFFGILILSLFGLLPLIWDQLVSLINEIPEKTKKLEHYFVHLSEHYPDYISREQIQKWTTTFQSDLGRLGKSALTFSITTITNIVMLIVYVVLVPLIVYFLLKDKSQILRWIDKFLPKKRQLTREVWQEINQQIGNYIGGKVLEIIIVAIISTVAFLFLGLNYAVLLGVLVGLSNIIPYVGIIIVTVPVALVGYLQWDFSAHFIYLMIIYAIINLVDGNLLAPILFSETMKLHPVAVIIAVIIFGGLWGFWGIFFALPLAAVVKALLNAWERHSTRGNEIVSENITGPIP